MTLDDFIEEWKKDSVIDSFNLFDESLRTVKLHAKWIEYLSKEKLLLKKIEADLKKLKHEKYEFYSMGPNEYTPKSWKLPSKGLILKSEVMNYVDSDNDVIEMNLRFAYQNEKVEFIIEVIKQINVRQWHIRNAIEWNKFQAGE